MVSFLNKNKDNVNTYLKYHKIIIYNHDNIMFY